MTKNDLTNSSSLTFGKIGWRWISSTCLFLLFVCSCESQKSSVTSIPGQEGAKSAVSASSGAGSSGMAAQSAGSEVKEQLGKEPEAESTNPPFVTKAQLNPERINNVDSLKVVAEGSRGKGEVTYKYEWMKNGAPAGDNSSSFSGFKRGDKISVRVTPYDGEIYGPSRTMMTVIENVPPKISEHKDLVSIGEIFSYQVKATDPDGDPLTYSLRSAPQGMTIDPSTGLIRWEVPKDFEGKAPVTVSVADGHGGEAFQTFSVDIKTETKRP